MVYTSQSIVLNKDTGDKAVDGIWYASFRQSHIDADDNGDDEEEEEDQEEEEENEDEEEDEDEDEDEDENVAYWDSFLI